MKYIDEFRNKHLVEKLSGKIKDIAPSEAVNIMEVCGTHTQSFFRFGLDKLLPENLNLIAGPGCPVCVSSQEYIDKAVEYAEDKETIVLTFGDMLRVPGTRSSLEKKRAEGADVRVVYSALDSINVAARNPKKRVVFLAVGFETTAPTIALSILAAKKENLKNLFFLSALKLIPPAMDYLLKDKNLNISGFLCPGHVSAIIGTKSYEFIAKRYKISCCVAGFEPLDILEGIYLLLLQIVSKKPKVTNQYVRVVTQGGNQKAQDVMYDVFKVGNTSWRGLGEIPESGLKIKKEYAQFDIEEVMPLDITHYTLNIKQSKCRCGDILKGIISPLDCPLFSKVCKPDNPYGPCMVSSEGACNAYYKYKK